MDRSYLSDQEVVEASRAFVCVRLLTYEDAAEARFLQTLFRRREGLENTVFTILDPAGRTKLVPAHRSPSRIFDDPTEMATEMQRLAAKYPDRKKVGAEDLGLPVVEDVRLGLNVAAADARQLIIVCGDGKDRGELESRLVELAWSEEFVGHFLYVHADEDTDWSTIDGSEGRPKNGIVIVQPAEFGLEGTAIAAVASSRDEADLREALTKAAEQHEPRSVDTQRLRRVGIRRGLQWKTAVEKGKTRTRRR